MDNTNELNKEKCMICNQYFKNVGYHVRQSHNISAQEYYDKYYKKEDEGLCKYCGKPTSFMGFKKGYRIYCSSTCSFKDPDTQEKIKKTNLEHWGTEWGLSSKEIREKGKKTNLEKYGVDNILKSKEIRAKMREDYKKKTGYDHNFKNPEIKEKIKQTNLKKLGVEYPGQSLQVQAKMKETCLKKYGSKAPAGNETVQAKMKETCLKRYDKEWYQQTEEFKEKAIKTNQEKYGIDWPILSEKSRKKNKQVISSDFVQSKIKRTVRKSWGVDYPLQSIYIREKCKASRQKNIIDKQHNGYVLLSEIIDKYGEKWRLFLNNIEIISQHGVCFVQEEDEEVIKTWTKENKCRTIFEREISNFVDEITDNIILNTRKIITPYELDIFIPNKNVAIECNGIYYHSLNNGTDKNYHLMKTNLCKEKGIRLLHINEWEWKHKQEICKSIIAGALGIYNERIYARNCIVKQIDNDQTNEFLNINHIQGSVPSSYKLGLFHKEELVQLITIGPSRFKKGEIELLRMCTKLNTQIIGGFSKLIAHLPIEYNEIYSFVDKAKFNGKGYFSTGWKFVSDSGPNYHYYKNGERFSRNHCQKYRLKSFLGKDNFDESLSETENMIKNGFLKVYDSGNIKVKLTR